jgi:hypothetical protein
LKPKRTHRFLPRRRPSPAFAISLLALFLSLGGVSYGVAAGFIDSREIKNNTVSTRDLRNNYVRTKDLRNNEVRGVDIRNSTIQGRDVALATITGDDIREATVAKVPSAERADTAGAVSSLGLIPLTTIASGAASVTLVSHGSLVVTAACTADPGGTRATVRVQTTEAGSAADGASASVPVLGPADGAQAVFTLVAAGSRQFDSSPIAAWAPSGKALSGVVATSVDPAGAGSCGFQGHTALTG